MRGSLARNGKWERVDIMNPTGSVHVPIDAQGITAKFRGINPQLDTDAIAAAAFSIEQYSVRKFLALLVNPQSRRNAA